MSDITKLPALSDEVEEYLTSQGASEETRYMARKYFDQWGKPSIHLDGAAIGTWPALMLHARGEENKRVSTARVEERETRNAARKARIVKGQFSEAWLKWQAQCTERNAWVEEANIEWRKRVDAMNLAVAQWKAHVSEARTEYQRRKAIPAPPPPVK